MSFTWNEHGQLCIFPQRYIEKMVDLYNWIFKENPMSKAKSPLNSNNHPKTDMTEFLGKEGIQMYQSLIGLMQWAISIGHFDIAVHVMTMSSFRVALHWGQLEQAKRMVGYHATVRWDSHRSGFWLGSLITLSRNVRSTIGPKLYMVISESSYQKAYQIL